MSFKPETEIKDKSSTRALFSGPDGNRMCNKTRLDPTYIGIPNNNRNGPSTRSVSHVFHDAPVNPHPQNKASWVGAVGWNVEHYNDIRLLQSGNQFKKVGFRREAERKVESHPKLI